MAFDRLCTIKQESTAFPSCVCPIADLILKCRARALHKDTSMEKRSRSCLSWARSWVGADFGVGVQNEVRTGAGEVLVSLRIAVAADTRIWSDGGSGTSAVSHGGGSLDVDHVQAHGQDCVWCIYRAMSGMEPVRSVIECCPARRD